MRASPTIELILASLALILPTCSGGSKTASVTGDVYLLMQNGDVKRGAANTVRLLADSGPLRKAMNRVCRSYAERLSRLRRLPKTNESSSLEALSAAVRLSTARLESLTTFEARMRAEMAATLLGAKAGEAATGVNAHYQLTGVAPGQYVLWAESEIGDHHYTWWAPVNLTAGDSAKRDLDNSTEADHLVYCGQYADSVARAESVAAAAESVSHVNPLRDCYREAERATTGYLEDRIAACNRKFGYRGTTRH